MSLLSIRILVTILILRLSTSCITGNSTNHTNLTQEELTFTSALNETFRQPNNNTYLLEWGGLHQFFHSLKTHVSYLRSDEKILERGALGYCGTSLEVLSWLSKTVNEHNTLLMIAYGELIHLNREKDLVDNTTKKYFDDDIDTFGSPSTIFLIARLEEELFLLFGWTARMFVNGDGYVIFMQMMATCQHQPQRKATKVKADKPAIEIYPLSLVVNSAGDYMYKDLWQNIQFEDIVMYPPACLNLDSAGTAYPLRLQVPRESNAVLTCLYGNWRVPSSKHVLTNLICRNTTVAV